MASPVITPFVNSKLRILRSRRAISMAIGILNEILSHSHYHPYLPRNQGLQSSHLRGLSHGAVLGKTDPLGVNPTYLKLQRVQQLYGNDGQVKLGARDRLLAPPPKDPQTVQTVPQSRLQMGLRMGQMFQIPIQGCYTQSSLNRKSRMLSLCS
jgi:hypothetical protein